jgi:hypothetical protein
MQLKSNLEGLRDLRGFSAGRDADTERRGHGNGPETAMMAYRMAM